MPATLGTMVRGNRLVRKRTLEHFIGRCHINPWYSELESGQICARSDVTRLTMACNESSANCSYSAYMTGSRLCIAVLAWPAFPRILLMERITDINCIFIPALSYCAVITRFIHLYD